MLGEYTIFVGHSKFPGIDVGPGTEVQGTPVLKYISTEVQGNHVVPDYPHLACEKNFLQKHNELGFATGWSIFLS